jgi:hypothetical protein
MDHLADLDSSGLGQPLAFSVKEVSSFSRAARIKPQPGLPTESISSNSKLSVKPCRDLVLVEPVSRERHASCARLTGSDNEKPTLAFQGGVSPRHGRLTLGLTVNGSPHPSIRGNLLYLK